MDQPLPFEIPNVTVLLQPEEQVLEIPRHKVKNVKQLLKYLGIRECTGGASCSRPIVPFFPTTTCWSGKSPRAVDARGEAARREFVPPGGKGETKAVCGVLLSFQGKTEGTLRRV